ncbi:MAG: hypothetical protein KC635_23765 [Myxococcales bacterium]|nr:hypothetical protein [Myxococcales bacterium]MCB9732662.1 hypothetical protein [Deltaproteobacteria bacterium]
MTRATQDTNAGEGGDDGVAGGHERAWDVSDTLVEPATILSSQLVTEPSPPPFPGFVDLTEDTDIDGVAPWFAREAEILTSTPLPPRLSRDRTPSRRSKTLTRPYDPPTGPPPLDDVIDDEPRWEDLNELLARSGDRF